MSCDSNFHAYCERIAGAGSDVATAFGGDPQQAQAALAQIFQVARNQALPQATSGGAAARLAELQALAQRRQAEDDTRRLFDDIRAAGLQPPTHSPTGLPKPDAQRGYAVVYQTLRAIATGTTLPVLAQQVAQAARMPLTALRTTLAQTQQSSAAPYVPLAQAQPAPAIIPGSPAFFAPLLDDIRTALETTSALPQKLTPMIADRCQRAVQAAPSLIDLANGRHAYGAGAAYQTERQVMYTAAMDLINEPATLGYGVYSIRNGYEGNRTAEEEQGKAIAWATVLCAGAGIQRCPTCGEFMGSQHRCPPTPLGERLSQAVALQALEHEPSLVELANGTHTFRKGGSARLERDALRIAGYRIRPCASNRLPGVPTAFAQARDAWEASETAANAAAFAMVMCDVAQLPRCPRCQGYVGESHLCRPPALPKLTGVAKKHAKQAESFLAQVPSLIALANGEHVYGAGPAPQIEQAALIAASQTIGLVRTAPQAFLAASTKFRGSDAYAREFAIALCTLAGMQKCQVCGRFRSTFHICPIAAPALPVTAIGPQTQISFATTGTALPGHKFWLAERNNYSGRSQPLTAWGHTIRPGSRQIDPQGWSSARALRLAPPTPNGGSLLIGAHLPRAIALLQRCTVVETQDGYVQLYDGGSEQLIAVYDPRANQVGQPDRTSLTHTPETMAVVIAYRLCHPENALDDALMTDFGALRLGRGSLTAVIDSAELVITTNVTRDKPLQVGSGLTVPRCAACGQWQGDAHICPVTTPAAKRKRRLADAAETLEPGEHVINNQHLAKMYSAIASAIAGAPRRVIFGQSGSGFATDMKGKIYADPQPLGPNAPTAHQLVVIKQGVYHELGHEEFTPGAMWRRLLDLAQAPGPVEVEVDPDLAALPSQAALTTRTVAATDPADTPAMMATLDAGRHMLPKIYNIIEDGGMERLIAARYAGAAEALAAGAAIYPRWHEQVGPGTPLVDEVIWPLLYTALPYFRVRDEVRAQMTDQGRQIFEELEPIVTNAVRGTPEDRFWATIEVTRRLEAYGLLQIPDAVATPPPPPSPGTAPFRGRPQRGSSDQGQPGQGGQGGATGGSGQPGRPPRPGGSPGGRGQADGQPGGGSGGSGGGPGQHADPDDERTGRGRRRRRKPDEEERRGRRWGTGGADDDDERTGRPGGQEEDEATGGGRGGTGADEEQNGAGGGGAAADDDQGGDSGGTEEDAAAGGGAAGDAAGDAAENAADAAGGTAVNESGDTDDDADGDPFRAGSVDEDDDDGDGDDDWDGEDDGWDGTWNDDAAPNPPSSGAGSGGDQGPVRGGDWRALRDPDRAFSPQEIADILDGLEVEATKAVDAGVRKAAHVESLGRVLNQPLMSTTGVRQRYRLPNGDVQAAHIATQRGLDPGTRQALQARRDTHQNIARDLAMQLKAIREQVDRRFRFQPEGRLDRRRMVAAVKGARDVHTRTERHPKTSFAASISVDLSGSMDDEKESGALFDATMVLGDTFDQLSVPHEIRAFDHDSYQYKSLGDKTVDLERAGRLTADGGGGTNMAVTAALATIALRARRTE